jgi:hypothetical protein
VSQVKIRAGHIVTAVDRQGPAVFLCLLEPPSQLVGHKGLKFLITVLGAMHQNGYLFVKGYVRHNRVLACFLIAKNCIVESSICAMLVLEFLYICPVLV